jgi:hypothetical protein
VSASEAGFNLREIVPLPRNYPVQTGSNDPTLTLIRSLRSGGRHACAGQGWLWPGVGSDHGPWVLGNPTTHWGAQVALRAKVWPADLAWPTTGQEPQRAVGLQC